MKDQTSSGECPVPKFLASLLLMLALSVTAAAQNRKISIDMQNITVKEFLRRNRENGAINVRLQQFGDRSRGA